MLKNYAGVLPTQKSHYVSGGHHKNVGSEITKITRSNIGVYNEEEK